MDDETTGTALTDTTADQTTTEETSASAETTTSESSATQAGTEGHSQTEESFLDNEELLKKIRSTPELNTFFKQMQGAFTKKMQKFGSDRQAADLVQRFNTDPEFARQTILQRAAQLGIPLSEAKAAETGTSGDATLPAGLVDKIKANLDPSLHWMAPQLANAQWAAVQTALKPLEEKTKQDTLRTRQEQYDTLAESLSEKAPGWEEHEDDMNELLGFLRAPDLTHRKFGSKLELLHRLVTGGATARVDAAREMAAAARNKTTTGQVGRTTMDNSSDQIRKAKTNREAWDIAKKVALAEAEKQGLHV